MDSAILLTQPQNAGYLLIFFLMIVEGPIVTYLAAFAASAGVFSISLIFILSLLGNLLPDILLFFIGKTGRVHLIDRYAGFFRIDQARIKKMEDDLHIHMGKTIVLSKLTPGFAIPGLLLAGFAHVPFKKFLKVTLAFNLVSSVFFTIAGFYSGIAIETFLKYLNLEKYVLLALVPTAVLVYMLIKRFSKRLSRR